MKQVVARLVFALAVLGLVASGSFAQDPDVPMLLNYQGQLKDSSGTPENGTFSMTFKFFDSATGGTQLPTSLPWSETQNVAVIDGQFNVLLGSVAALPHDLFEGGPVDVNGPLRFLEVSVSGEILAPRRRIGSAAFAINPRRNFSRAFEAAEAISVSGSPVPVFVADGQLENLLSVDQVSGGGWRFGDNAANATKIAQGFRPNQDIAFNAIRMLLSKTGSPVDSVSVTVVDDNGGEPGNNIIAASALASTSLTETLVERSLILSSTVTVLAGTDYWVVAARTGALDANNYYNTTDIRQSSPVYSNGYAAYLRNGVWTHPGDDWDISLKLDWAYQAGTVYASDAANPFRDRFTGLALTSASAPGDSIELSLLGITDGFGSLTTGMTYYVQNGGGVGLVPGDASVPVGLAVSSGEILVGSNH